jgi:hypothetical protein
MLWRWRANASQQQITSCTVSVSYLQNLQVGSPSNRPIIYRCHLREACPVKIATTVFSWCLLNLSRPSAVFLHSLPIKSLAILWPGKYLWTQKCLRQSFSSVCVHRSVSLLEFIFCLLTPKCVFVKVSLLSVYAEVYLHQSFSSVCGHRGVSSSEFLYVDTEVCLFQNFTSVCGHRRVSLSECYIVYQHALYYCFVLIISLVCIAICLLQL